MNDKIELTSYAVETAMNLLIHTNGKTSSLEVKNLLREQNYFATQQDVSVKMRETVLSNPEDYLVTPNGTFIEYTFAEDGDLYFNYGFANDDNDTDDVDTNTNTATMTTSTSASNTASSRDPKSIFYTENDVTASKDMDWVVFDAEMEDEFHVYDESITRDRIRSRYASLTNIPIQNVRARRFKNFAKAFTNI